MSRGLRQGEISSSTMSSDKGPKTEEVTGGTEGPGLAPSCSKEALVDVQVFRILLP